MLGNGDGTFQPPTTYTIPQFGSYQYISSFAVGDFNHDGKADVAVAVSLPGMQGVQNPSGDVLVFLGSGDGTLQPPTTIALTYPALSLVQADVNGDGNQDLVLLQVDFYTSPSGNTYISAEVSVLLGNGNGTFQAPLNTPVPAEAIDLAVGDLNGDGKPDLVTANQQSFSILLGNGDGTFQTPVTPAIPADSVALADFTANGKLDLVVSPGAGGESTLSILLGNGNGTFQNPAPVNLGATCVAGPFVVDLNVDGKPDLVDPCGLTGVVVLLGNGDGTFGAPEIFTVGGDTAFAVTADFNVDGKPDLATANYSSLSILLGKGDGTFIEAPGALPTLSGQSVIAADFNRDGKSDLAVGSSSGDLVIELGNGDGTFTQSFVGAGGGSDLLATADFNQDGKLDIFSGGSVWLGNGDGTFQPPMTVVSDASFIAIADFNLDGKPDLVLVDQDGTILYLGNGDGTFQTGLVISSTQASVVAGDFNHDGKPDLIIGYSEGGTAVLLLGNGDGTFQSPVPLPTVPVGPAEEPGIEVLKVGDFNNDGKLDLAVVYPYILNPSFVGIVLGNGDGTFQTAVTQNAPEGPTSYVLADMNGDGNLDLVTANPSNNDNNVSVWLGNGDGTLQAPQDFGTGPNLSDLSYLLNLLTVADFNQDGLPDLAVIGTTPPGPWMLFQLGTARVPAPTLSPNSLTFAPQAISTTSAPQAVTLTVAGNAPLNIAQIVTSGDFVQTNNCPSSVAVGSNCTIQVTFTPTSAGARDGSLVVEDNAPDSPQKVSLTGTGLGPLISLMPTLLSFPSQPVGTSSNPQVIVLSNPGTTTLQISKVATTGDFQSSNTCGATVAPGASCNLSATFTPMAEGTSTGQLIITDNAPGSPHSAQLSGVGSMAALGLSSDGSSSATVGAGSMATYKLTIGGAGSSGMASLACTGAPQGANCSFPSGATMNVSATSATPFNVTVTTTSRSMAAFPPPSTDSYSWLWAVALIGFVILPYAKARTRSTWRIIRLSPLVLLLLLGGCGSGSSGTSANSSGTPAGTYSLMVKATSGSVSQSVPLTLTVQ